MQGAGSEESLPKCETLLYAECCDFGLFLKLCFIYFSVVLIISFFHKQCNFLKRQTMYATRE